MKEFPFLCLQELNDSIGGEIREKIDAVIAHGKFIMGPEVPEFERAWATFCGADDAIGCSNGTSALHTILSELGVSGDDEVIVPSHTFIATAEAVRLAGATPVFAEIDERTMLMDPSSVRALIRPRTAGIMPVHLYGAIADMDALNDIARPHGIPVIEDASQAHGATYKGRKAGSLGTAAGFSFFPGKNLGAFGDAGAVTTSNAELGRRIRLYVNHGRESKYEHLAMGTNYRLDTIQAAVLLAKLHHLEAWTSRRREVARVYTSILDAEPFISLGVRTQSIPAHTQSSYHLYVIRVPRRDDVQKKLKERGVATGIHYPIACHMQGSMADVAEGEGALPITERVAREVLSLPMCPTMVPGDAEQVCEILRNVLNNS
jgi:dTDP-4-amino-4,6-dideoxygalactose transaminase